MLRSQLVVGSKNIMVELVIGDSLRGSRRECVDDGQGRLEDMNGGGSSRGSFGFNDCDGRC